MFSRNKKPLPDAADQDRGHKIDREIFWLSVIVECMVGGASLLGAGVFATLYGHDLMTRILMMLPPIAFAAIEAARIPLAIKARTHASWVMRLLATVVLLLCAAITAKSLSQVMDQALEPRLAAVRSTRTALDASRQDQAAFEAQRLLANDEVARDTRIYQDDLNRMKSSIADLGRMPHCRKCGRDANLIRGNVHDASTSVASARRELDEASQRLRQFDASKVNQTVRNADIAYREAVNGSQLHLFCSSLLGIEATKLTDGDLARLMRILILAPALLCALVASLLAMVAVTPAAKKNDGAARAIEIPDELFEKVLAPTREAVEATATIVAEQMVDFTRAKERRAATRNRPVTPSASNASVPDSAPSPPAPS